MKLDKNQWISFENVYNNINYELDSVKFNKVLAFDILMTVYDEDLIKSFSYFSIIKNFFKTIYFDKVINSFKKNSLLATNKTKRADYNELFKAVLKDVNDFSYLELSEQKNIFKFNFKSIYISIKKCAHLLKSGYGFKNTIYISSKLCFYLSVYKDLIMFIKNKNSFSLKAYLAFNSAVSLENLITQVLNHKTDIETFSLTHEVVFGDSTK
jgi:hypothetical protein